MASEYTDEELQFARKVFASIPPPESHLLFLQCPRCQGRFWNRPFSSDHENEYRDHFLFHIFDDLRSGEMRLGPGGRFEYEVESDWDHWYEELEGLEDE